MDKSSKLNCNHREHQDYTTSAQCHKFAELTGYKTKFDPSVCQYCLQINQPLDLQHDPLKSQYHRLIIHGVVAPPSNCSEQLQIKYEAYDRPDFNIYGKQPKYRQIAKWAVGVITAPRKHQTLVKTIKAIERAGWDNGVIFAEPGSCNDVKGNWAYVNRYKKTGIFGNWMLGLYELFIRNIDADAFLMIQDDIVIAPDTRNYLDNALWFTESPHLVSLFTLKAIDDNPECGWRSTTIYHGGPTAIVMSHETVQEIISSLIPLRYYGIQKQKGTSFDDLGIFALMAHKQWPVFYPKPSIGDHIGHQSTHCQQAAKWSYSDHVLVSQQYNDVEHWFITDNRRNNDISAIYNNLEQFKPYNWLAITDELDPIAYLEKHCQSEWIITTNLCYGTTLKCDIRHEIIQHFAYEEQWLKFGFGLLNGQYVYTENGPCQTLCEKRASIKTCLSTPKDYKIISHKPFWASDIIK